MAEWLADHEEVRAVIKARADSVIKAALMEVPKSHRDRLRRETHLACGLLAEMAEALAALTKVPEMTGEAVTDAAFPPKHRSRGLKRARLIIMRFVVIRLVDVMLRRAALDQLGPAITALRAAAVATCPDVDRHKAVRDAFAALAVEKASEATTSALRETFSPARVAG